MDKPSEYECEKCHKTFDEMNQCACHLISCSSYKCSICDNIFENQEALGLHISKHKNDKSNIEKTFNCDICNQVFQTNGYLDEHTKNVHNSLKPTCSICSKQFIHDNILKGHVRFVHEGEFTFPCELKFSNEMYLKNHKKSRHSSEIHNCQMCKKCARPKMLFNNM